MTAPTNDDTITLREQSAEETAGEDAAILAEAQREHAAGEAGLDVDEYEAALLAEEAAAANPATDTPAAPTVMVLYEGQEMEISAATFRLIEEARETLELPKQSFRKLAGHMFVLDTILTALGGELTPELEAVHGHLLTAVTGKIDNTLDYLTALGTDAEAIRLEEKRLADQRKRLIARVERIEKYVLLAMQMSNRDEIEGTLHKGAQIRNNPPKLVVTDRGAIDKRYVERIVPLPFDQVREDSMKADLLANEKTIAAHEKALKAHAKALKKDPNAKPPAEPKLIEVPGAKLTREQRLAWS